ncbi:MAG: YqaE/Pmp3 family membrane protein [Puniceicoccales bacterium]
MSTLLLVILSILLPPAAVAVKSGIGFHFVLNIILTLLAWVPGVIHALYVVLSGKE